LRINGRDDVYLLSYFIHKSTRSYQSFGIVAELPELSKSSDAWECEGRGMHFDFDGGSTVGLHEFVRELV